ncbi:AraC family transcriptional regulator [Pendulispora rubella]|uniref:AraC family transcriptional regulator n=1 Tax=Pendulispora rubella TaxID=2741070 RepID=A0ABZ2KZK6_9BACT
MAGQGLSSIAFKTGRPGCTLLSSEPHGWRGLLVRSYLEPEMQGEPVRVPPLAAHHIVLMTSGWLRLEQRDADGGDWERFDVGAGDIFITPAMTPTYDVQWHSLRDEPVESVHLHLEPGLLEGMAADLLDIPADRLRIATRDGVRDPVIQSIALELCQSLQSPHAADRLYVDSAARMVAAQVLRHHIASGASVVLKDARGGLPPSRVRRVTDFIVANLSQSLDLESLAAQAELSPYHFARTFKQSTGETPHGYVLRRRIEKARELLRQSAKSIAEVAFEVGFSSQSHFTTQFRKLTGSTPRQYRRG